MCAGSNVAQANTRSFDYENGLASESVLSAQDDSLVGGGLTYTPTGCLLPTATGVSHLYLSGFSPLTMA